MKLGFIGAGNMAAAIIKSLYNANSGFELCAYDLDTQKVADLSEYNVKAFDSASQLAAECDYILLAIKPQNFEDVLADISQSVNENAVIISIAAGITAEYIKSALGFDAKVVLVMPNTPLMIGEGATALAQVEPVSDREFAVAVSIFDCAGITAKISPDKMKEIIPINGSSPAFIYAFARGFIEYAKSVGIDCDEAKRLFSKTLVGSAKMITESGFEIDELIKMVSSKGGTTIAGLSAFDDAELDKIIGEACERCTKRAYELSK